MKRFLLILLTVVSVGCSHNEEAPPKPLVAVKVTRAQAEDVQPTVQAPATIFPREQADVSARVTGPILSLKVRKGESITKGQVLAVLESKDVEAQRAEAAASVADAEATLQKMSGGTLPAELEQARGQVRSTDAALNQAQKLYDRRRVLFSQGAIPNRDLLASETDFMQAKSAHDVAVRSLELIEKQSQPKDLRIAESRLQQAKARHSLSEAQLQFTELRSPLTGTVTEQFLFPGGMAKPDAPVFTVMDLSVAIARAQTPEVEARRIARGQSCSFTAPSQQGAPPKGTITVVNQAVDPARRTVEVWCEIPNSRHDLKAGVFGSLTVSLGKPEHGIVLPEAAVQFKEGSNKGSAVIVDQKNIAHIREVEAKRLPGGKLQIVSGIQAGETVVIEGGYGLPEGTQVTVSGSGAEGAK